MIDINIFSFANFLASELRAQCIPGKKLYITGNMKRSIVTIAINNDTIDVVIATDYASYTNTRGKQEGWVERTIRNCARCYSQCNQVSEDALNGLIADIRYE